ncbi:unnamed protein product [Ectocarpus fasciculatus]
MPREREREREATNNTKADETRAPHKARPVSTHNNRSKTQIYRLNVMGAKSSPLLRQQAAGSTRTQEHDTYLYIYPPDTTRSSLRERDRDRDRQRQTDRQADRQRAPSPKSNLKRYYKQRVID